MARREDATAGRSFRLAALGAGERYGGLRGSPLVSEPSRSQSTVARRQGHPAGEDRGQVCADSRAGRAGSGRGGLAQRLRKGGRDNVWLSFLYACSADLQTRAYASTTAQQQRSGSRSRVLGTNETRKPYLIPYRVLISNKRTNVSY